MIDRLTADDFAAHVGRTLRPAGYDLALTLVALDRHRHPGWEARERQPFSLILSGPREPVLPEGFRRVAIDGGPSLLLYVIPIFTVARDRQDYQIVFN